MIKALLPLIAILLCELAWSKRTRFIHLGREFVLVTPNGSSRSLPLLVVLHGCRQDPDSFLDGSQLDQEAEKNRFIILAPEQPAFANYERCWNWFLDIHQTRNLVNEMGQVVSAVDLIVNQFQVSPGRIFVAGMSAGGAMAHNLAVCYPDVFSAAAIHSGVTYKAAETIAEADSVLTAARQKSPDYLGRKMAYCARDVRHRLTSLMIIHGALDQYVPVFHSQAMTDAHAVWRDLIDDGRRNNSARPAIMRETQFYPNGYSVTQTDTKYQGFLERKLVVKPLNHAWGGGKQMKFFDPKAPSSNTFILKFFGLIK